MCGNQKISYATKYGVLMGRICDNYKYFDYMHRVGTGRQGGYVYALFLTEPFGKCLEFAPLRRTPWTLF
jgi:extradiol dioxygenase family protein